MSDDKAEPLTIDQQDFMEVDETEMSAKMAQMRSYKTKPKAKSKQSINSSVSDICESMGYVPAVTLVHLANNNPAAIGLKGAIPAHTVAQSATTLLSYTAPRINNVDFINTEEKATKVLAFTPVRGSQVEDLIAELDAEVEDEYEEYEEYEEGEEELGDDEYNHATREEDS